MRFAESVWNAQKSIHKQLLALADDDILPGITGVTARLCSDHLVLFDVWLTNGTAARAWIQIPTALSDNTFDNDSWAAAFWAELSARPRCLS